MVATLIASGARTLLCYTPKFEPMKKDSSSVLKTRSMPSSANSTWSSQKKSSARASWVTCENAECQAAKERQTYVNARIAMLKRRVSEIALMNLDRFPAASFGSTVTIREGSGDGLPARDAGRRRRREGLVSTSSPIDHAILNKEKAMRSVSTPTAPASSKSSNLLPSTNSRGRTAGLVLT
jgi:transcription elongation GreA/GreB family factor